MPSYRVDFTGWAEVSKVTVEVEGAEDEAMALLCARATARHCLADSGIGEAIVLVDRCRALPDESMVREVLAEALSEEGGGHG